MLSLFISLSYTNAKERLVSYFTLYPTPNNLLWSPLKLSFVALHAPCNMHYTTTYNTSHILQPTPHHTPTYIPQEIFPGPDSARLDLT